MGSTGRFVARLDELQLVADGLQAHLQKGQFRPIASSLLRIRPQLSQKVHNRVMCLAGVVIITANGFLILCGFRDRHERHRDTQIGEEKSQPDPVRNGQVLQPIVHTPLLTEITALQFPLDVI